MSVWVYSVFVLSCVDSGLAKDWLPVQVVIPVVRNVQRFRINSEWEQAHKPNPLKKNTERMLWVGMYATFGLDEKYMQYFNWKTWFCSIRSIAYRNQNSSLEINFISIKNISSRILHSHRCENLKSYNFISLSNWVPSSPVCFRSISSHPMSCHSIWITFPDLRQVSELGDFIQTNIFMYLPFSINYMLSINT
jgi:hypothetical protein